MEQQIKPIFIEEPTTEGFAIEEELKYVDEDIRESFTGKNYAIGIPTNIQLNRNINRLIDIIRELIDTK